MSHECWADFGFSRREGPELLLRTGQILAVSLELSWVIHLHRSQKYRLGEVSKCPCQCFLVRFSWTVQLP